MREGLAVLWEMSLQGCFQHLSLVQHSMPWPPSRHYKGTSFSINIYLCKRSQVYCLLQSYLLLQLIKIGAGQFCKLSRFNVNNNKKRRQKPERREKTKMKPVKEKKKKNRKNQPRIRGLWSERRRLLKQYDYWPSNTLCVMCNYQPPTRCYV